MPFTEEFERMLRKKKHELGDKDLATFESFREAFNKNLTANDVFRPRKIHEHRFKRVNGNGGMYFDNE